MSASCGQEKIRWITTIILSSSLQDHEISTTLQNQQHRVRYSDSVEDGCIIFSLSGNDESRLNMNFEKNYKTFMNMIQWKKTTLLGDMNETGKEFSSQKKWYGHLDSRMSVAFLLADIQDLLLTNSKVIFERIKKFMTIHRNGFLLLSAALHGSKEWEVMFRIQQRFLGSNLRIVPVHNTAEAIKLMLTIAKTASKPYLDNIHYRMLMAKTQMIEQSPVWKMLHHSQLH